MGDETVLSGSSRKAQAEADVSGKFLGFREVEMPGASNASPCLLVKRPTEEEIRDCAKPHTGRTTLA